jgi:hypothetical protein
MVTQMVGDFVTIGIRLAPLRAILWRLILPAMGDNATTSTCAYDNCIITHRRSSNPIMRQLMVSLLPPGADQHKILHHIVRA